MTERAEVGAGRELDVQIAEEVMGLTVYREWPPTDRSGLWPADCHQRLPVYLRVEGRDWEGRTIPGPLLYSVPPYSTTWEGMRLVVERMRQLGWYFDLADFTVGAADERVWEAVFVRQRDGNLDRHCIRDVQAPTAVAQAALKALESSR